MPLTAQRETFCREYLVDLCGAQAAIRAGYKARMARKTASRLLTNADIQARVAELMEERKRRTDIDADRVVRELACVAFLDPRKLFRPDGGLKAVTDLDDDSAAALASLEVTEEFGIDVQTLERKLDGYAKKVKFWDKIRALELLGKHVGMWPAVVKHQGDPDRPIHHAHAVEHRVAPDALKGFAEDLAAAGMGDVPADGGA